MTLGFASWSYCKNVAQVRCIRQSDVAQICLADNFTVEEIAHKHYTTKQRIQYSFIGLASERLDQFIPGRLKIIEELPVHAACWVERFWMLVEKLAGLDRRQEFSDCGGSPIKGFHQCWDISSSALLWEWRNESRVDVYLIGCD